MITIKNLNFGYTGSNLFNNLNLSVKDGNIYGLLGKNGAGKTTLLKIITGIIFPTSGECSIFEELSSRRLPETLKEIFFIPESFNLPEVTLTQFYKLNAFFYEKFNKNIFLTKVDEFELPKETKLNNLSFGQKKKFMLAFGIATGCRILIFDEPTNGLDIPSKRIIRNNLLEIKNSERIIIISTHNVKELENIFDSIIILEKGQIIFKENITTIKEKLQVRIVSTKDDISGAIYHEQIPGGYSVLLKNDSYNKNEIDLEFLFNAAISNTNSLKNIFND